METLEPVGLSALQLDAVFPFHIVIGGDMSIVQLGSKWSELMNKSCMIGQPIGNYFLVTNMHHFEWNWQQISTRKDSVFDMELCDHRAPYRTLSPFW